jgi:hypothetical protein
LHWCIDAFAMHAAAATVADMTESRRPGLKPGQRHSGSFRKGDDPRRTGGAKLYDGMTVAQMCRLQGPRSVEFLTRVRDDESAPLPSRIRAVELLLDRGFGRAVSIVDMQVTTHRSLTSLSTEELEAIARGESPRLPITLDGEAVEVLPAVPSAVPVSAEDVER